MKPDAEKLMLLLHDMTGWGDSTCRIKIGYMRARVRVAQDETKVDDSDWGWIAQANVCNGPEVNGQGKTLEEALMGCAIEIQEKVSATALRHNDAAVKTCDLFAEFKENYEL